MRDEERFLPGFLHHVAPHVDGIIALDDGSTDATAAILKAEPLVQSVLQETGGGPAHARETSNRFRLLTEAARLGADWVLCADADERFETGFLRRLRLEARRGERDRRYLRQVTIFNLWNRPDLYRVDGPSGPRPTVRMFRLPTRFTRRPAGMHQPWFPSELDGAPTTRMRANLYHLRMIDSRDRQRRFNKFNAVDPHGEHQSAGYGHMVDEERLQLRRLPFGRGYADLPRADAPAPDASGPVPEQPADERAWHREGYTGLDFAALFSDWRRRPQ